MQLHDDDVELGGETAHTGSAAGGAGMQLVVPLSSLVRRKSLWRHQASGLDGKVNG